jgi:serine/threonine protein kinase
MSVQGSIGEGQVRWLMQQMLDGIAYLHSKTICHRDVKPHNYFLMGPIAKSNVKVKLGDFGAAVRLPMGKLLKDQVGTPAFMAPEIHLLPRRSQGYEHKVDVWALGVSLIFLLASEYPFIDGKGKLLRQKIIQGGSPLWDGNTFDNLFLDFQEAVGIASKKRPSKLARSLTRSLLAPCFTNRLSAAEALRHEWFTMPISEGDFDNLPLLDSKVFEKGLSSMMNALSNVQMDVVEVEPSRNHQQVCADITNFHDPSFGKIMTPHGVRQNFLPPPPPPPQGRWADPAQPQRRQSWSGSPPPMPPPPHCQPAPAGHNGSCRFCCLCRSEASMLDHTCPSCNVTVCAACISERMPPQGCLRCPSCNRLADEMRLIGNVHNAKTNIGNVLSTIASSLSGEQHHQGHWQSGHWQSQGHAMGRRNSM